MLDLDTSTETFTLIELDFDPEVPCFRADHHGSDPELHAGAPVARYYMTMVCLHCDAGTIVLPVCESYKNMGEHLRISGEVWYHNPEPGCGGENPFEESVHFTPISLTDR